MNIANSGCLCPHPIWNGLVEVTKETENLLVQNTVLGDKRRRRSGPGEAGNVVFIRKLVLVHQLTANIWRKFITARQLLDPEQGKYI